jgi:hypothetical protein
MSLTRSLTEPLVYPNVTCFKHLCSNRRYHHYYDAQEGHDRDPSLGSALKATPSQFLIVHPLSLAPSFQLRALHPPDPLSGLPHLSCIQKHTTPRLPYHYQPTTTIPLHHFHTHPQNMAPIGFVIPVGAILAASSSSHDSTSSSGVPFSLAILIAFLSVLGLILVPLILYAIISSLIRCCKARCARRRLNTKSTRPSAGGRGKSWPGCSYVGFNGCLGVSYAGKKTKNQENKPEENNGHANAGWPGVSPTSPVESPLRTTTISFESKPPAATTSPTSPYVWKTIPVERSRSMKFPATGRRPGGATAIIEGFVRRRLCGARRRLRRRLRRRRISLLRLWGFWVIGLEWRGMGEAKLDD